jgi:hypothetical protein
MTTKEIADRLVELNRSDNYQQAYQELYTDDLVSVENWGDREVFQGMQAVIAKGEKFMSMVDEMHSTEVGEPVVADHCFAVTFTMDATFSQEMEGMTGRQKFTEIAVYRVNENGKIYHEEFFG